MISKYLFNECEVKGNTEGSSIIHTYYTPALKTNWLWILMHLLSYSFIVQCADELTKKIFELKLNTRSGVNILVSTLKKSYFSTESYFI